MSDDAAFIYYCIHVCMCCGSESVHVYVNTIMYVYDRSLLHAYVSQLFNASKYTFQIDTNDFI